VAAASLKLGGSLGSMGGRPPCRLRSARTTGAGFGATTPAADPPQDEETVLPNASVGIDRLRALLRRPRSRLSATALRFHRQAIRGAASLRLHLVGRPLEPQPTVAVISLARPAGVDARAGLAVARPTSPEAAPTSPEPASWSPTGTPPSHQPALLADGRLGRRSAPRLRPAGGTDREAVVRPPSPSSRSSAGEPPGG